MNLLSGAIVVASGLWLIGLAVAMFLVPDRAERFLMGFASSAHAHYFEQALRLIAGGAIIVYASAMRFPDLFRVSGWVLVATAAGLLLMPWTWHRRFGEWAIPLAIKRPTGLFDNPSSRERTMTLMKHTLSISAGVLAVAALAHPAFAQTVFPTGTTIYKPDEASSSYILISDHTAVGNHPSARVRAAGRRSPGDIRLIDMNGNVIHTWNVAPYFNKRSRLLPNGNLVYVGPNKTIYEYDWDGNVVWTHEGIGSVNDLRVLPNNNRLLIAHEPIPEEFQRQVRDVEIAPWWAPRLRGSGETQLGADLYEVNLAGEVVWEWHAHNHLDLNLFSPATPEGDWLHVNSVAPLPENKWYDAGDERFKPGNILLNARNINMVYIIDKESKEVVWEGTHHYKGGLSHAHEAEMIEKGLPGAGNIILFDNGLFTRHRAHTGQTFIVEMDPTTQEIVWIYETEGYANLRFFSKSMGTQQRLANGNTYIAEDNTGRLFQVKPDGEIVWEYVNRGGTTRPSVIPYDFTPQLRALPRPEELRVTPPNNLEWHITPDILRETGRQ